MTLLKSVFSVVIIMSMGIKVSFSQKIPSPKEHFGFAIGENYQLATYSQTAAYFSKLAAASARVKLVDIGKTEEGRTQLMMVVSSPDNIRNLEKYQQISRQLAHAENLTDEQARQLAAEGKAVVWIDGGLHSTETVGTHQLIETAYQLVSREDPETMAILDHVIILLTHANPDGQELVSNWYMRDSVPEKRSLEHLPVLYEKYAGHDNNRDFYMLNLKETQNIGRQLFIEWLPQIMYNHHQAGPAGSVLAGPPYRDPFNYVFDPMIITSLDAVGAAMSNRLNAEGKPGYTERNGSTFSTWYNGGLRTTTYFHNMIGLLTEIIGSPTPSAIPLVPERLLPSGSTPNPVTPRKWYFRQSIDYSVSLNYAVLDYAVRYRDQLLFNIYRMGKNSIARGEQDYWTLSPGKIAEINRIYRESTRNKKEFGTDSLNAEGESTGMPVSMFDSVMKNPALRDPRGYVIPSDQPDFPTAVRFVNALIRTGIVVSRSTAPFVVNGRKYPSGSYIVKTNQAFRPHVLDMFEPQDHPNDFLYPGGPPVPPYDAAGWTLAYLMGIRFDRILEGFDGPFERIAYGELQSVQGMTSGSERPKGYLLDVRANASFLVVNDLLHHGVPVFRIIGQHRETGMPAGSFYIQASAASRADILKAMERAGINASGVSAKPTDLIAIHPARIALYDNYGGSIASGWIRWLMEQFHFGVDIVYPKDIDAGGLKDKYDVIIFVDGAIPAPAEAGVKQPKGRPEVKDEDIPVVFRKMTGHITREKSVPAIHSFLEEGGHVVTIGSSANLAYQLELPVRNALMEMVNAKERKLPGEKYYIPGSILRVSLDTLNKSAWGMYAQTDVYFDGSPVFYINPDGVSKGTVKPIAWFSTNKPLRSGWAWGQDYLKNGVTAFEATVGKGSLWVFGPEITFRAQTHGTFKLLFNQLYQGAMPH